MEETDDKFHSRSVHSIQSQSNTKTVVIAVKLNAFQ